MPSYAVPDAASPPLKVRFLVWLRCAFGCGIPHRRGAVWGALWVRGRCVRVPPYPRRLRLALCSPWRIQFHTRCDTAQTAHRPPQALNRGRR